MPAEVVNKDYTIKSDKVISLIDQRDNPQNASAFRYAQWGINIKPHEIRHLSKVAFLKPLANYLKERQRESLLISLFAKAVVRTRGKKITVNKGTQSQLSKTVSSPQKGHWLKNAHMKEFRQAFVESTPAHYAKRHEFGLALHWIEETMDIQAIVSNFMMLLAEQFNRLWTVEKTSTYLKIKMVPIVHTCEECGRTNCEYPRKIEKGSYLCCRDGSMSDAVSKYCSACSQDHADSMVQ